MVDCLPLLRIPIRFLKFLEKKVKRNHKLKSNRRREKTIINYHYQLQMQTQIWESRQEEIANPPHMHKLSCRTNS